jgi:SAM-dependent methyltransferase
MQAEREANRAERQRWNDPSWTTAWLRREPITASVTAIILGHLDLGIGERVLDIASGTGGIALEAAQQVGPTGRVTGVDLSERLVAIAPDRAARVALHRARFVVADAQTDAIDGGPFDAATSQFGVMFFDDPVAAFANVAGLVVAAGRLVFACWQRLEDNPWCVAPALSPYLIEQPSPTGGTSPGPFSMGDPDLVVGILHSSGWRAIERTPYSRRGWWTAARSYATTSRRSQASPQRR